MINNLSQLKKVFQNRPCFKILNHRISDMIGQIRKVNVIQTNGFYSIIPNDPNSKITLANGGRGFWLEYGKSKFWKFENDVCSLYSSDTHEPEKLIISIQIID